MQAIRGMKATSKIALLGLLMAGACGGAQTRGRRAVDTTIVATVSACARVKSAARPGPVVVLTAGRAGAPGRRGVWGSARSARLPGGSHGSCQNVGCAKLSDPGTD
jgi:hypothetical protein